jgi:hypothetical protein
MEGCTDESFTIKEEIRVKMLDENMEQGESIAGWSLIILILVFVRLAGILGLKKCHSGVTDAIDVEVA